MSRRRFLQGVGAGVAATAISVGSRPGLAFGADAPHGGYQPTFGRLFLRVPPFANPSPALTEALVDFARPGGFLDAKDDLAAGPVKLITEPELSAGNPNNPTMTAGLTFLRQFMDHDVTFDTGSKLGVPTDPRRSLQRPYAPARPRQRVRVGPDRVPVPLRRERPRPAEGGERGLLRGPAPRPAAARHHRRSPQRREPLHRRAAVRLLEFHNRAVSVVRGRRAPSAGDFERARRLTTWHYQWIVVHAVLPPSWARRWSTRSSSGVVASTAPTPATRSSRWSSRARRTGSGTRWCGRRTGPTWPERPTTSPSSGSSSTRASTPRPTPTTSSEAPGRPGASWAGRRSSTSATARSSPTSASTPSTRRRCSTYPQRHRLRRRTDVLAQRTLLRHVTWSLPSGQALARRMGAPVIPAADFPELAGYGLGLDASTPLFHYVLKEAELLEDGLRLGPVGGRIVAEVFLGLLQLDPDSYLNARALWRPTLPTRGGTVTATSAWSTS